MRLLLEYGAPTRPRTINDELPENLVNRCRPELQPELTKILTDRRDPIHRSYHREDWFHGKLSRNEANALLEKQPDGNFILRTSNRPGKILTASMITKKKRTIHILASERG